MPAKQKTVIIVAGPTAAGKTDIAIRVAKQFGTEIISADSRQCYIELNIGVARPSQDQLALVPHHFIASHSIHEKVNAASYEKYALQKVNEIFSRSDIAVMVGGTGLYIKSFCEGLDYIPEILPGLKENILNEYKQKGLQWLQSEVQKQDGDYYAAGEIQNPHRMIRALEVILSTGKSILSFQNKMGAKREFKIIKIGIELPKEQLHENINTRVEQMIEKGLVAEVQSLWEYKGLPALNTVGYKELFLHLEGKIGLGDAIAEMKKHTRQYAKRQLTWFKKDKEYQWLPPDAMLPGAGNPD